MDLALAPPTAPPAARHPAGYAPRTVRGFDPARESLVLTVDAGLRDARVTVTDAGPGCEIALGGRVVARLDGVPAGALDDDSLVLEFA